MKIISRREKSIVGVVVVLLGAIAMVPVAIVLIGIVGRAVFASLPAWVIVGWIAVLLLILAIMFTYVWSVWIKPALPARPSLPAQPALPAHLAQPTQPVRYRWFWQQSLSAWADDLVDYFGPILVPILIGVWLGGLWLTLTTIPPLLGAPR
jgi:uncharacterized membrane protein YraQ (UPF0718 family)